MLSIIHLVLSVYDLHRLVNLFFITVIPNPLLYCSYQWWQQLVFNFTSIFNFFFVVKVIDFHIYCNILTVMLLFLLITFSTEFTATFHTMFYRIFRTEFTAIASSSMTIYVATTNKKLCFLIFLNKPGNFPFGCLVATI